jgi:hypothetical protein
MTYKFQRGPARLSGSIVQLSGSTDVNATTVDSLDVDTDGISIGGTEIVTNTRAIQNVTTVSGSGNFFVGDSIEIAGSGSVNDFTVLGNLVVEGTTTTINSEIQTADASLLMNVDYTSAAIEDGYIIWNTDPDPATTTWTGANYNIFIENKSSIKFNGTNLGGVTQFDNISNGDLLLMKGNPEIAENGIWEIKEKGTFGGSSYIVIKSPNATVGAVSPSSDVADFVLDDLTNFGTSGGPYLPSDFEIVLIKVVGIKTDSANDKVQVIYGTTGGSMSIADISTGASVPTSVSGSVLYSGGSTIVTTSTTVSDSITLADTAGGAFSLTMPNITDPTIGTQYIIKDQGGNCASNALTINQSTSGHTIDGLTSIALESDYGSVTMVAAKDGGDYVYVIV